MQSAYHAGGVGTGAAFNAVPRLSVRVRCRRWRAWQRGVARFEALATCSLPSASTQAAESVRRLCKAPVAAHPSCDAWRFAVSAAAHHTPRVRGPPRLRRKQRFSVGAHAAGGTRRWQHHASQKSCQMSNSPRRGACGALAAEPPIGGGPLGRTASASIHA